MSKPRSPQSNSLGDVANVVGRALQQRVIGASIIWSLPSIPSRGQVALRHVQTRQLGWNFELHETHSSLLPVLNPLDSMPITTVSMTCVLIQRDPKPLSSVILQKPSDQKSI